MPNLQLVINCDGGSRGNPGPAACAFVVHSSSRLIHQSGVYLGVTTNNLAEYSAVHFALKWLETSDYKDSDVQFKLDSLLVVNQIKGLYKVKEPTLKIKYLEILKLIEKCKLKNSDFLYVPRAQNSVADKLVNLTLDQTSSNV